MSEHIHRGAKPPQKIEFEDTKSEIIFPTKVWSAFPADVDNDEIIEDCYAFRDELDSEGVTRSNVGGWQSEVKQLQNVIFRHNLPHIYDLGCRVVEFANECYRFRSRI